jgi:hypothetical protein
LHEFPFTVYEALPLLERREDGLWWMPDDVESAPPLSFSLRAVNS